MVNKKEEGFGSNILRPFYELLILQSEQVTFYLKKFYLFKFSIKIILGGISLFLEQTEASS